MTLQPRNSGGEAGKLSLMSLLALSGRESYLLFYKMAALLLTLNLILLGVEWTTAMVTLPTARGFFAESAVVIAIFLMMLAIWLKPLFKYHWKTARELSEKNELTVSLKVQLYRMAVSSYWQVFVGYSLIWAYLALASGLLSVASGCTVMCLMILAPGDDIAGLVETAWATAFWSAVVQTSFCLLAHKTIIVLTAEREETEDVSEEV